MTQIAIIKINDGSNMALFLNGDYLLSSQSDSTERSEAVEDAAGALASVHNTEVQHINCQPVFDDWQWHEVEEQLKAEGLLKPLAKKPVVVVIEGGMINDVYASVPVIELDYDTDGCEEGEITRVPQTDGSKKAAVVRTHHIAQLPSGLVYEAAAASLLSEQ